MMHEPAYLRLLQTGELEARVLKARQHLEACRLCPRACGADRRQSARSAGCRTGERARVASYGPHYGEEAPLVGLSGSGTIFFSGCNLSCLYCQNYTISQLGEGQEVEAEELAAIMLRLQAMGCHNVNLVSPSHVVPQILAALLIAARAGLRLPLVYNSGGYDALDTLALLDGVVDVYMPDAKYADDATGRRLSLVRDYPAVNRAAVREMHRQVGDLQLDGQGIARRGLLVRHLVLPGGLAGTAETVRWLAELSPNTYVNVMGQYRPCYRAHDIPELRRPISRAEHREAIDLAVAAGLRRLDAR
jgi:putative pyruvate formate lyase activating enzyme